LEAIASCENSNSRNTVITLQLLEKQVRKMKTLETRINGKIAEGEAELETAAEADTNRKSC